ncbi:MAG: VCBS repeat-containing protein [Nitrospirae bacterium]|nr:VCBS repeat-containing protein [Nitrospirota bacterium]
MRKRNVLFLLLLSFMFVAASAAFMIAQAVAANCTMSEVTLNPMDKQFSSAAGSGSFSVTTTTSCTWNATTADTSWVTITSGVSGTGNGTLNYSITQNTGTSARTGIINVAGQAFTVKQDAAGGTNCTVTLSPVDKQFPASGGTGSFSVTASSSSCTWTANTVDTWVTITSGASGTGNGTVNYSVAQNTGTSARTGIINVAGQAFTVKQDAAGGTNCTVSLNPLNKQYPASGGTGSFSVTSSSSSCTWTANTVDTWVTITSGASGTGNGTVNYSVAQNTGSTPRTGIINVSGQAFTVKQDPAGTVCTGVVLNPMSKNFPSSGGSGSFSITASTSCTWNATTADSWVTITSGASGTGNGTVNYSVAQNTSSNVRTGIINVAGFAFMIQQDPAGSNCTGIAISPTSKQFAASGGSGSFNVTAPTGCTWNATTADTWITITSGSSGTGNATVNYTVAQNTGTSTRTGIINIAGAVFTIKQDPDTANCSGVVLSPTQKNYPSSGGSGSFSVTAPTGCTWNATTADSWLTITSGASGSGNGTVNFTVSQNTGTSPRTGIINLAGKSFTVIQDPVSSNCSGVALNPMNKNYPSSGGTGSFSVTAPTSCTWNATTADSWVTITSGASGSGNGTVNFSVAQNTGTSVRTGIINVAGQAFTIVQDSTSTNCTGITISPTSKNFAAAGGSGSASVTAATGCTWSAASSANWIIITSGSAGTGNGTVSYNVEQNIGTNPRTGKMTIGGQTLTITQDAATSCTILMSPTTKQFLSYGGSEVVNVSAASECSWTAASNDSWITITSPTSGTGNGAVSYSVSSNTGAARTGTMTIGGLTFTVTQTGTDCTSGMSINPTSKNFISSGGSDTVNVTTPNTGCSWTAISNDSWINITAGSSATGNATVSYTVSSNTTSSKRTGTMTIAGQTFTVTQDAPQSGQMELTVTIVNGKPPVTEGTGNMRASEMEGPGAGTVTVSNGKFTWSHDGKIGTASFTKDAELVLTAIEGLGLTVKAWTGCDSIIGSVNCMVKMAENKKITIEFSAPKTVQYDFDGDGNSDVVWRNATNGDVYIWMMDGTTIKGGDYVVRNTGLDWDIKAVGDFNGDGRADILWQNNTTGDVYIFLMNGTQISTGGFAVRGLPKEWTVNALGDFDGDGKTDIMWRNTVNGDIYIWLMDGTMIVGGGFVIRSIGLDWEVKIVSDLNGDKMSDIIWQNKTSGDVFVWLMNGLTVLSQGYAAKGVPSNWQILTISDFDGDGKADILWQDTTVGDYVVWLMDGTTVRGGGYVSRGVPSNWQVMKAGDYNGNGKADIIWRDNNTGDVYLYLMDGATTIGGGFVASGVPSNWQTR